MLQHLRRLARQLKQQTLAVYLCARDPRTPWAVRVLAVAVAAYALSPIDLIPDFIPVLGYLDDLILLPLGIWLIIRLTPTVVWLDCQAAAASLGSRPTSWSAAVVIVLLWCVALGASGFWLYQLSGR